MTKIDRESVERLARFYEKTWGDDGWPSPISDTLLALRAALDEAEARADREERHAEEWMLGARAMEQKLASMGDAIDRAAQEARAVALQDALNKVSGCDRVSEVGPAIRALMSDTAAEALERAVEALGWYQDQMCEGFCKDLRCDSTYTQEMDDECAGCKARATLAAIQEPPTDD